MHSPLSDAGEAIEVAEMMLRYGLTLEMLGFESAEAMHGWAEAHGDEAHREMIFALQAVRAVRPAETAIDVALIRSVMLAWRAGLEAGRRLYG